MNNILPAWQKFQEKQFKESLTLAAKTLASHLDNMHICGLSFMELGRIPEGLSLLKAVMALRPNTAYLYSNPALMCEKLGLTDDVEFFCDLGLALFPDDPNLLRPKANSLIIKNNHKGAIDLYQQVLKSLPHDVATHINLTTAYRLADDPDKAFYHIDQARLIDRNHPDIRLAKALLLKQVGRIDEAISLLDKASEPNARATLAHYLLAKGDYERGWKLHFETCAHTWAAQKLTRGNKPFASLDDVAGRRLLITNEGGHGDLFMFFRYIPLLAAIAESIILPVPESMISLLQLNCPQNVRFSAQVDASDYDCSCSVFDAPYYFKTTVATVPHDIPYLRVPASITKLPSTSKKRVGLVWAGGAAGGLNEREYDSRRSISLDAFAPLADDRIEFVSLQLGEHAQDIGLVTSTVLGENATWLDTARVVDQLDLIISVDTAVVHLAAAMGKPTWLLSRLDACWRWLQNRLEKNPWYPDVRIFGQTTYGDWVSPIQQVRTALMQWAEQG